MLCVMTTVRGVPARERTDEQDEAEEREEGVAMLRKCEPSTKEEKHFDFKKISCLFLLFSLFLAHATALQLQEKKKPSSLHGTERERGSDELGG